MEIFAQRTPEHMPARVQTADTQPGQTNPGKTDGSRTMTEPCPTCKCDHIGTDISYAYGAAMFCQNCGLRGPRAPIDMDTEYWLEPATREAEKLWNQAAKPIVGMEDDIRVSG